MFEKFTEKYFGKNDWWLLRLKQKFCRGCCSKLVCFKCVKTIRQQSVTHANSLNWNVIQSIIHLLKVWKKRRLDLFLLLAAAVGLRKRKIQHTDFGRYPGLRRNVLQPLFTRHRDTVDMCDNYIKRHFMLVCFILVQADWNITEFSPSRNCCSACWGSGNVLNLILEKIFHILGYIYMSMDVQCA